MSEGVLVAGYYAALVDTATGGLASAYDSGDGVHPTAAGSAAILAALCTAVLSGRNHSSLLLARGANDPWNFTRNAPFLSAFGTGWSTVGVAGATTSTVSSDATILDNWRKIVATATATTAASSQNQTTTQGGAPFTVVNRLMFGCRIQSLALSSSQSWNARVRSTDGIYDLKTGATKIAYSGNGGMVQIGEGPEAPTMTYVQSLVEITAGTGDVQVAQFTAYDLQAMGVTDASGNLA